MFNVNFDQLNDIKELLYLVKLADYSENSGSNPKRNLPGQGNFKFLKFYNYLRQIKYKKLFSIDVSTSECFEEFYEKIYNTFKKI
jgi:hypothetical protein